MRYKVEIFDTENGRRARKVYCFTIEEWN